MIRYLATLILLIAGTYFTFDWVFSSHTALFFTDLATVIIAEIIFLGNFPLLTDKSVLNIKGAVGGVIMNTCVVSLLVWMFIYNLLMRECANIEIFWIGDFIIIGYLLLKVFILTSTAEAALSEQEKLDSTIRDKKEFKLFIMEYSQNIIGLINCNENISNKDSLIRQFRIAIDKVVALPSNTLQNETLIQDMHNTLEQINSLCSEIDINRKDLIQLKTLINNIILRTKNL